MMIKVVFCALAIVNVVNSQTATNLDKFFDNFLKASLNKKADEIEPLIKYDVSTDFKGIVITIN